MKYNRIKTALTEVGKQSKELAENMGVHETTVSDWCTNKNQPSIPDLFRIAKFLKMNVRKLLVATNFEKEDNVSEQSHSGSPIKQRKGKSGKRSKK